MRRIRRRILPVHRHRHGHWHGVGDRNRLYRRVTRLILSAARNDYRIWHHLVHRRHRIGRIHSTVRYVFLIGFILIVVHIIVVLVSVVFAVFIVLIIFIVFVVIIVIVFPVVSVVIVIPAVSVVSVVHVRTVKIVLEVVKSAFVRLRLERLFRKRRKRRKRRGVSLLGHVCWRRFGYLYRLRLRRENGTGTQIGKERIDLFLRGLGLFGHYLDRRGFGRLGLFGNGFRFGLRLFLLLFLPEQKSGFRRLGVLVEVFVKILCGLVLGAVVGKPREQISGGVRIGIDRLIGINVVLALVVVYRVKEIGKFRFPVSDGRVVSFPAAAVTRGGDHSGTGRIENMLVGQ